MTSEINRLRFSIQGPNEDFSYRVEETATNGLVQDGDNWTYRFNAKIPMDAVGSYTLGVEGRLFSEIDVGEDEPFDDEDQMETFSVAFAVTDDSVMPRRQIVDDYKCENCHSRLSLHGDNRQNATDYCQTCHSPDATDAAVRPEGTGEPQSIDFRYMVHKIHRGAELETGYTVYGYRSSFHDYSEVHYVGELSNCEGCHVDDSYMLPLPATNMAVTTPRDYWSPMLPETASCLSCHDSSAAASHADSNTGDFGESCSVCHGEGSTYAVEAVHSGLGN
jgi:OmcA/MtrC family decaheme c-type cytochrome